MKNNDPVGFAYCPHDGQKLADYVLGKASDIPQHCKYGCGSSFYHSPMPVAVAIVTVVEPYEDASRYGILVVHRRRKNRRGSRRVALPGGYTRRGETLEAAVARELAEETGLSLPVIGEAELPFWQYVGSTYSTSRSELLTFFAHRGSLVDWAHCQKVFVPNEEVEDISVVWFYEPEACQKICFSTHKAIVEKFIKLPPNNSARFIAFNSVVP